MFDGKAYIGDWEEAKNILEQPGFVSMEDNGRLKEGDYAVIDKNPEVEGLYIDHTLFNSTTRIDRESRNSGGFYFMNSDGSPVELKYRFPEELREYPETVHLHNVPELYVPTGSFKMAVASKEAEDNFVEIEFDSPLIIPSGMYHGIQERESGSGLIVARGDPKLGERMVGKWDLKGEQMYDHAENLDFAELTYYEDEKDEMHYLW